MEPKDSIEKIVEGYEAILRNERLMALIFGVAAFLLGIPVGVYLAATVLADMWISK